MKDSFFNLHPLVSLTFFAAVIAFSMFIMQPVCLGITLVCALLNALHLSGGKTAGLTLKFLLPMTVMITVVNPLFNHRGATVLCYFPWGNPLTLESVLYGFASALLISAVALWFSCVNSVMTSDKLIFLFGSVAPSLSLVLSMAMRFLPRFTARFKQVRQAQACLSAGSQSLVGRFRAGVRVMGIMVSWSFENAIDTSDSMKSRGYGLKGRTAFAIYRFHRRDAVVWSVMLSECVALAALLWSGQLRFRYFPSVRGNLTEVWQLAFYVIYAVLLLTPLLINAGEGIKWNRLQSKT